jgi:hypothetical protein
MWNRFAHKMRASIFNCNFRTDFKQLVQDHQGWDSQSLTLRPSNNSNIGLCAHHRSHVNTIGPMCIYHVTNVTGMGTVWPIGRLFVCFKIWQPLKLIGNEKRGKIFLLNFHTKRKDILYRLDVHTLSSVHACESDSCFKKFSYNFHT